MKHERLFLRSLFLALTISSCNGILNTDCDLGEDAILNELPGDQPASAPKICFTVQETERCFYLLIPECAKEPESVPLVVDLHDTGKCPSDQSRISGWKEYALSECFAVAWPLGTTDATLTDETCFVVPGGMEVTDGTGEVGGVAPDCCCRKGGQLIPESSVKDIDFLYALIPEAIDAANTKDVDVDPSRIIFTGYGNGATAAMGFTVLHSEIVSCAAPFSGHMVTEFPSGYNPVPVFSVTDAEITSEDEEVEQEHVISSLGTGPFVLPSPFRANTVFAEANQCGIASSRSNVAVDKLTQTEGTVTGGKFSECLEPVNFLQPPFAAYKLRETSSPLMSMGRVANPVATNVQVNRVVDTTGIAFLFCKERHSITEFPTTKSSATTQNSLSVFLSALAAITLFAA